MEKLNKRGKSPSMSTPIAKKRRTNVSLVETRNNDDEKERSVRNSLNVSKRLSMTPASAQPSKKQKFSETEIQSHVELCKKLYSENRISLKNAWDLNIISAIQQVLEKEKVANKVFHVAGTSLDVGAKVYSCRVDDIYQMGLQLSTKLTSEQSSNLNRPDNDDDNIDTENVPNKKQPRMRKICNKNVLEATLEQLTEPLPLVKLNTSCLKENIDDVGASNLINFKISIHPSTQNFLFLEHQKLRIDGADEVLNQTKEIEWVLPHIPEYAAMATAFKDFAIGEDEENDLFNNSQELVLNEAGLPMVDLDGSIPNLFEDHNDFNDQNSEPEDVNEEVPERIIHVSEALNSKKLIDDYNGYTMDALLCHHFIGPSYWKIKYNRPLKPIISGVREVVKAQRKKKVAVKVNLDIVDDFIEAEKERISRKSISTKQNLSFLMADYFSLESVKQCDFFLTKPRVRVRPLPQINTPDSISDNSEHLNTSLPDNDINNDFDHTSEEIVAIAGNHCNNLVDEPDVVQVECVAYAKHAKKLDMRNLKKSIWKTLKSGVEDDSNKITVTDFKKVYKELPNLITESTKAELTPHLALVAVLHLCNEHSLILRQKDDRTNFSISNCI